MRFKISDSLILKLPELSMPVFKTINNVKNIINGDPIIHHW